MAAEFFGEIFGIKFGTSRSGACLIKIRRIDCSLRHRSEVRNRSLLLLLFQQLCFLFREFCRIFSLDETDDGIFFVDEAYNFVIGIRI